MRALPWREVLRPGLEAEASLVLPFGNDALYHLRRIAYSIANFPSVLDFDRYINFPSGARPIWTPAFDWLVALALGPWVGALETSSGSGAAIAEIDTSRLEQLAIWVPPLLGALAVMVLVRFTLRLFGPAIALVSGLALSLSSAHFWYSQIGFVDHHVAVALASTVALGTSMIWLERNERGCDTLGGAIGVGLSLGAALLLWPGCLAHVGLLESGFALFLVTRRERDSASRFARQYAIANGVATLLLLPAVLFDSGAHAPAAEEWGRYSPAVMSRFQPWFFGIQSLLGGGCALLWRRGWAGRDPLARFVSALGLCALLLALCGVLLSGLATGADDAWRWLFKQESFQAQVAESEPLFFHAGELRLSLAAKRLSLFVFCLPPAILWIAIRSRREARRAHLLLLLWYAAGLLVLTALQKRFFNSLSVPLSLLMGITLCWLGQLGPGTRVGRVRTVWLALVSLLGLALASPMLTTYSPYLRAALAPSPAEVEKPNPIHLRWLRMAEVALWLERNTPATSGWLDASLEPEYGVLAPWFIGHFVEYLGRRPTINNAFGDDIGERNFELARRYFLASESEALAIAEQLRARYVISSEIYSQLDEIPARDSIYTAQQFYDGTQRGFYSGAVLPPANPLTRHRLLFESAPTSARAAGRDATAAFKVYEVVEGARVVGSAEPGAELHLKLPLRTNRGRDLFYSATARADATGRYELRVPYANRGAPPAVRVGRSYTIECIGKTVHFAVNERAVRNGEALELPPVCPAGK